MIPTQLNVHVLAEKGRKFLQLRWTDPSIGQVRKRSAKTVNRREAERAAAKLEKELRAGCAPDAIKWDEFRQRHEAEARRGLAKRTCDAYDVAFDHLERVLKPRFLRDLTPANLSKFVTELAAEKSERTKKTRSHQTVAMNCRHIKAALRWAYSLGLLTFTPKVTPPKLSNDTMKGRAITAEEYERMLSVQSGRKDAATWQRFITGLWWSGLRLSEAFRLSWDPDVELQAVLRPDGRAFLKFGAGSQKAKRAELWPCAPEFALFLAETPEAERTGAVFELPVETAEAAGRKVSAIGSKAGVLVGPGKTASAHDLRRSFGTRWSKRVMPAVLQRLMRHKSIQTSLRFYVWHDADEMAGQLWDAYKASQDAHKSPISGPTKQIRQQAIDVTHC
ncbi:MAG: site-specific integrase [Pirellulales bacterium]|nr:site-specific integrase [Pirellulales bacterium]